MSEPKPKLPSNPSATLRALNKHLWPSAALRAATLPAGVAAAEKAPKSSKISFTIPGAPMGKPRMTQRDKWKKRPCVMRYRAWADKARAAAPKSLPIQPLSVSWVAYLPMPKSWNRYRRETLQGKLHRQKPDRDNIDKAVCDALWKDDSVIALGSLEKRWDDGKGPRIEVTVTNPDGPATRLLAAEV